MQVNREALLGAVRLGREEVRRIQREVVCQEQRGRILRAKYETLCLKHSSMDQQEKESLVHPASAKFVCICHRGI